MSKIDEIYQSLIEMESQKGEGISAAYLSEHMHLNRANVSRYLNQLVKDEKNRKNAGETCIISFLKTEK